jgi:hypothetical protein
MSMLSLACSEGGSTVAAAGGSGGDGGVDQDASIVISVDGGRPRGSQVRMAVPAYFQPGSDWDRLIAAAPTVGMIVFNPNSGPGSSTDAKYTAAIAKAQAAGIIVLGYVSTNYGQRAEADITADINGYYNLYKPSGVYLAEGPLETDCTPLEAEYQRLSNLARSRDPKAYLAVGTRYCPSYIYFFDLMVEFARNWTEYQTYTPPSWMPANSPERFCNLVNAVSVDDAGRALTMTIANGAGWVFVTDQADPNPWGLLPSYFDSEVRALRALGP